jgi:hypothetical protein
MPDEVLLVGAVCAVLADRGDAYRTRRLDRLARAIAHGGTLVVQLIRTQMDLGISHERYRQDVAVARRRRR